MSKFRAIQISEQLHAKLEAKRKELETRLGFKLSLADVIAYILKEG